MRQDTHSPSLRQFFVPVAVLLLLLGVPYLLRPVARVLLAIFAGILLAVFLDGATALLCRLVSLRRGAALAAVILLIVLAGSALVGFGGAQVAAQATGLVERLPTALEEIRATVEQSDLLRRVFSWISQGGGNSDLLGNVTSVFSSTIEAFTHLLIIVFTGVYVAINPGVYSGALMAILPPERRLRGREVLAKLGQVMRYWLLGRMASMSVIGVLTAVGLLFVGAPLALILGVIAGLLSFIPFLGPVLSAVPAILVAFTESPRTALWVVAVFAAVQFVESNLITPLIERRAVKMPPAFVVAGQFLMAVLVGFYGVLLATPFLVLITVLVQMLYIQDVLGDEVGVLGIRDEEGG